MTPVLGIITGIQSEAAALGRWRDDPRIAVAVTAGRPDRAEAEAGRLASAGIRALLSWGIAGGLDPALDRGALLVADGVVEPGGRPFAFDAALVAACRAAPHPMARAAAEQPRMAAENAAASAPPTPTGGIAAVELLAGSDLILFAPAAKAALRRRTNAVAVDMESHRVAAVARGARLPSLAVRAVSDPARRRLPAVVAHALDDAGRPRAGAVLRGIARRPWDLPALVAAGRDSRAALAALAGAAEALIPAILSALDRRLAG